MREAIEAKGSGPATVVVARRVREGQEAAFERWVGRMQRAVERAPGLMRAEFNPPSTDHPSEWLTVYRFCDADALERWLTSAERSALVRESESLLVAAPREQRIVEPGSDSVTLVSSILLPPGKEHDYRLLYDGAVDAARKLGGLLRAELLPAIPNAQPETVVLMTFRSRDDLDRWLGSEPRQRALEAMDALADSPRTVNVVGGFAGWFHTSQGVEPKRWKQACVVFMGLLPVAIGTRLVRDAIVPDLHLVPAMALGAFANVVILTWLVMPWLSRALHRWLAR